MDWLSSDIADAAVGARVGGCVGTLGHTLGWEAEDFGERDRELDRQLDRRGAIGSNRPCGEGEHRTISVSAEVASGVCSC